MFFMEKIGNYCQLKAACCNIIIFRVFCVFRILKKYNFLEQIFWSSSLIFLKAKKSESEKIPLICEICVQLKTLRLCVLAF